MAREVELPDLGEGVEEAEVVSVLVSVGDEIEEDQSIIGIESEKAAAEVPSSSAGTVSRIRVKEGDRLKVGDTILELDGEGTAGDDEEPGEDDEGDEEEAERAEKSEDSEPERATKEEAEENDEKAEKREKAKKEEKEEKTQKAQKEKKREKEEKSEKSEEPEESEEPETPEKATAREETDAAKPSSPLVTRLARELGVDLADVTPANAGNRITESDVKRHVRERLRASSRDGETSAGSPELPDFGRFGEVERRPLRSIRRAVARAVTRSWREIPLVTQFDAADVTALERTRREAMAKAGDDDPKVTITAILVKSVAAALGQFPELNASLDPDAEELVLKRYVNVGVAVDTEHGLLVPVVRDADTKSITTIAREVASLAAAARARELDRSDLEGACITVTNLGGLGTTSFCPLVNWPEVAVVGVGRAEHRAVYAGDSEDEGTAAFRPRLILPLAISYDHRVADGADAARFLRWVAEALEQPIRLSM